MYTPSSATTFNTSGTTTDSPAAKAFFILLIKYLVW